MSGSVLEPISFDIQLSPRDRAALAKIIDLRHGEILKDAKLVVTARVEIDLTQPEDKP